MAIARSPRQPGLPGLVGLGDRMLAESLIWLLLLTWVSGVVIAGCYAGGMTAERQTVPAWVVVVSSVLAVVTVPPVRWWVRPRVEALLFTHPEDAAELITEVGREVARSAAVEGSADAIGAELANRIARRLRLPYAAIVAPGQPVPDDAPAPDRLVRVPLTFAGEAVGSLLVLPRHARGLAPDDEVLLAELAVHVGIALHAARVTDAVRSSRAALVTAREEERRRIRRDLHDGLGPTLASLRLHLAALQQLVPDRPDAALELVARLRDEVRATSGQVRSLVYDLRPPALDELGLAGALRARAADVAGPAVTVALPDPLPELPAAVEVALYRIAAEALENVTRHAGASRCSVRLVVGDGAATLEVADDGRGLPRPLVPGVGVAGMRERAEEIGGTCTCTPGPEARGTLVRAVLPIALSPREPR